MTFPPIRPQLTPCVLAALDGDAQTLADVCRKVGRDPRDRSVRRVLAQLAAEGLAIWTEDGWASTATRRVGADDALERERTGKLPRDEEILAAHVDAEVNARLDRIFEGEAETRRPLPRMAGEDAEFWRAIAERDAPERAETARLLERDREERIADARAFARFLAEQRARDARALYGPPDRSDDDEELAGPDDDENDAS